jgi:hypothetical protein
VFCYVTVAAAAAACTSSVGRSVATFAREKKGRERKRERESGRRRERTIKTDPLRRQSPNLYSTQDAAVAAE